MLRFSIHQDVFRIFPKLLRNQMEKTPPEITRTLLHGEGLGNC